MTAPTSLATPQVKLTNMPQPSSENPNQPKKELGNILNVDGKLTEGQREQQCAKGLCFYCEEPSEKCQYKKMPTTSGWAISLSLENLL